MKILNFTAALKVLKHAVDFVSPPPVCSSSPQMNKFGFIEQETIDRDRTQNLSISEKQICLEIEKINGGDDKNALKLR